MDRIILLNDDLESQMRIYLALCPRYRIDIAEDEISLMRLVRRKRPHMVLLDAKHGNFNHNGKSATKLIEKIKHKYNRVQILAIVDPGDEALGRMLEERGADGWVDRLADTDEFVNRVDRLFEMHLPFSITMAE